MSVFILVFPLPSLEYSCNFTDQLLFLCVFLIMWLVTQEILLTTYNIHGIVLGLGDSVLYETKPYLLQVHQAGEDSEPEE